MDKPSKPPFDKGGFSTTNPIRVGLFFVFSSGELCGSQPGVIWLEEPAVPPNDMDKLSQPPFEKGGFTITNPIRVGLFFVYG